MSAVLVDVADVLEVAEAGAPIVLVTGLPGAGKTLFSLAQFAVGKSKVYQAGVPGCALPQWAPEEWQEMPEGSTLIVDEAQEYFAPKSPTGEPPSHYVLNKIRHRALALVLITQHPNNLDARVRRLVGRHVHVVAAFGADAAVVYEWRGVGDVDSRSYDGATRSAFKYPKDVYKLYKSADAHRPKQKAPFRVRAIPYILAGVVALLAAGGWMVYRSVGAVAHGLPSSARSGAPDAAAPQSMRAVGSRDVPLTPAEYAASFKPRVAGLDYSAPRYDQVTKPVRAPVPAACISDQKRCKCYTQQATPLDVGDAMCRQIVAGGYFKDFDDGDDQKNSRPVATPAAAVVAPVAPVPLAVPVTAGLPRVAAADASVGIFGGTYARGH